MLRPLATCLLIGLAVTPVIAQRQGRAVSIDPPTSAAPPERVISLVVYGEDKCPPSSDEEIVVCARVPESERYRLPERFRSPAEGQESEAWANKVTEMEYISRIGTPNSCSPVGSGGFTGCYQQFMRQARAERAMRPPEER